MRLGTKNGEAQRWRGDREGRANLNHGDADDDDADGDCGETMLVHPMAQ